VVEVATLNLRLLINSYTDGKPYRYACFELHPDYPDLLFSVLEDHTIDIPADVVTTLVIINTKTKAIYNLLSGSDFYALPKLSPNGKKLAWVQWSHPDMPWEGGEVHIGDVIFGAEGEVSITNDTHVGGVREKVGQATLPGWTMKLSFSPRTNLDSSTHGSSAKERRHHFFPSRYPRTLDKVSGSCIISLMPL